MRPAILAANRIDQQREAGQSGSREHLRHHLDDFGVDKRRFRSNGFRANLKELPVAALLRALAAKHRAHVIKFLHARLLIEPVFDVGANHRRSIFRAQHQPGAIAIFKRVHLFGDNVGIGADSTGEELFSLKNRVRISR